MWELLEGLGAVPRRLLWDKSQCSEILLHIPSAIML